MIETIIPGSTIGIIGGGQLGRMLAQAAASLGYRVHVYTPEKESPAADVAFAATVARYDDAAALTAFAASVDVITFEFENIPYESLELLESMKPVRPGAATLKISRNRIREKTFIQSLGIATAPFACVTSEEELWKAAETIGYPSILKTTEMGYDGKGQVMLKEAGDVARAWESLATREAILEGFVDFTMEISVIIACSAGGEMECYVPVQNIHKHHILDTTIAPAPIDEALTHQAQAVAVKIAQALKLQGLLAVEMFITRAGAIVVNELAPRPHNSGHWTMDACVTGQFEQAIRAICGLPLGSPARLCDAEMKNLIGDDVTAWADYAVLPHAKLHLYGKKEIKPGRKMGHVNFLKPVQ